MINLCYTSFKHWHGRSSVYSSLGGDIIYISIALITAEEIVVAWQTLGYRRGDSFI